MEKANEHLLAGVSAALRETFLGILDREEAKVFRTFMNVVENRFLDRAAYEEGAPSYTLAEMRGAALDLRFIAIFLELVGREREASELSRGDWLLSSLAAEVAGEVAALAERFGRDLARLSGREGGAP